MSSVLLPMVSKTIMMESKHRQSVLSGSSGHPAVVTWMASQPAPIQPAQGRPRDSELSQMWHFLTFHFPLTDYHLPSVNNSINVGVTQHPTTTTTTTMVSSLHTNIGTIY
jgi:hypothetical protein